MANSKRTLPRNAFIVEEFLAALEKGLDPVHVGAFYYHLESISEDTGVFEPKIAFLTMGVIPHKSISEGIKIYNYLFECRMVWEFKSKEGVKYGYLPMLFKHNVFIHPKKPLLPFPPKEWWLPKHNDMAKRWLSPVKKQAQKPKEKPVSTDGQKDTPPETPKENNSERIVIDKEKNPPLEQDDTVNKTIHEIITFWNRTQLPHMLKLTEGRRAKLKVRLQESDFIKGWKNAIIKMSESDLCLSSNWANFDFLVNSHTNYIKILEGKYDNKKPFVENILNPKRKPVIADYSGLPDPRQQVKFYQRDLDTWNKKYGEKHHNMEKKDEK